MNACYGGTLYQDLETEHAGGIDHHMMPPYDRTAHQVTLQKDTLLYHRVVEGFHSVCESPQSFV